MDSFELNKILGALLATIFILFSVAIVSDSIFAAPVPAKPGFIIEAAEEDHGGGGGEAAGPESILPLLASASPDAGATVFKKCTACHTAEKGGPNKAGPNLWDIVNRPVASHEGFGYSAGMKAFAEGGKIWDYEHLDHFLNAPKAYVKGTAMGFGGVKKTQERADLVAYLHTLSDSPAPLPAATAPAAPAAEGAAADGTTPPAEGAAAPADAAPEPAPAQ
ncbi:MAG: cytochrome c family protein [Rhizobiaceae bacterium]|nr:cytochrome c family protein [Rhizobiaceae bacterium]